MIMKNITLVKSILAKAVSSNTELTYDILLYFRKFVHGYDVNIINTKGTVKFLVDTQENIPLAKK